MSKYKNHKNFKVKILTLPLESNYGGILQAYSLQSALSKLGFSSMVVAIKNRNTIIFVWLGYIKRIILAHITSKYISSISPLENIKRMRFQKDFIEEHINYCPNTKTHNIEDGIFIVGSDQVWRRPYSTIPQYLLNFTKGIDIKRISYAASFGKDDLSEYGDKLIKKSAALAKKFDAISVREDSGVDICNEYWGVKAQQHVDPTLLLEKNDYLKLIHEDINILKKSDGQIFTYVLDSDKNKDEIIDKVSSHLKLKSFDIMPPKPMTKKELRSNPDKFALPHVTQWLKSFKDADFVITDSFHGTVFSIIFNKPFIAIGNKERGLTRFSSLLRLFKLEDRLVSNSYGALSIVDSPINWKEVNEIKLREKKRGIKYLKDNLQSVPQVRNNS